MCFVGFGGVGFRLGLTVEPFPGQWVLKDGLKGIYGYVALGRLASLWFAI